MISTNAVRPPAAGGLEVGGHDCDQFEPWRRWSWSSPRALACRERSAWLQGHHVTAVGLHNLDPTRINDPHLVLTSKEGRDPHVFERRLAHHMVRTELVLRDPTLERKA